MDKRRIRERGMKAAGLFLALVSAVLAPWWLAFAFLGYLALLFEKFYEAVFVGLFIDLIYSPAGGSVVSRFRFTIVAFLVALLVGALRRRLSIYGEVKGAFS